MDNILGFKSGFVTLIGRPNVGKSTLLNKISGLQLAITSPKPQTTRHVIRTIHNDNESQIVFMDTPGMHQPKTKLEEHMVSSARQTIARVDIVLLLIEAVFDPRVGLLEKKMLALASQYKKPVILVINKADLAVKENILPLIAAFDKIFDFIAIIPISARTGDGITELITEIKKILPEGPRYFPQESFTDQTERMIASELIREQILNRIHEEIPHGTAVIIESFEEVFDENDDSLRTHVSLNASILCDKASHKGIIIGKQGQTLKAIGIAARKEIEDLLGCTCYLQLFVKVREDWRNRQGILNDLGYGNRD